VALADEARLKVDGILFAGDVDELLAAVVARPEWQRDAACLEHPELTWFPERSTTWAQIEAARAVCRGCLVADQCDSYARRVPGGVEGIWGGLTTRQRPSAPAERVVFLGRHGDGHAVGGCTCEPCRSVRNERQRRRRAS
jgi:hypothetical protein